jgi:hypothetical protein
VYFNIYFTLKGPAGVVEAPNRGNPFYCGDLASLLAHLAVSLPRNQGLGLETVGVRVEPAEGPPGAGTGG